MGNSYCVVVVVVFAIVYKYIHTIWFGTPEKWHGRFDLRGGWYSSRKKKWQSMMYEYEW